MADSELIIQLKSLINGLWLPSETEAPWTVPTWNLEIGDAEEIRQVLRREEHAPVVEMPLENLMEQVQQRCQGYGDEGKAIASQHRALANFLHQHCNLVRVFRVGEVTVDVLIVGQTPDGDLVLQSQSVET